jgi:hypothetical protein
MEEKARVVEDYKEGKVKGGVKLCPSSMMEP